MEFSTETKYMLFMFLGLMVAILVLGYHRSPQASPSLGATQLAQRQPLGRAPTVLPRMSPVSTETYDESTY